MRLLKSNWIYVLISFLFLGNELFGGNSDGLRASSPDSSVNFDSIFPIQEKLFVDSLTIGVKGLNKLEVRRYQDLDSLFIQTLFFEKNGINWTQVQKFEFETSSIPAFDVEVSDFNNDGFLDFTYNSAVAGRGANEIRKLFIFDLNTHRLIYIKNSENYPNLLYNAELDCIDSWMVYGGSSTVFLKLDADTLTEFACVSLFGTEDGRTERIITETDSDKIETILFEDFLDDEDVYTRYRNYRIKE